jgi:nicotinamide riboside transporter PnuC
LISRKTGLTVLVLVTLAVIVVDLLLPKIPQPQSYHNFADQRRFLGIPNFGDVVSNVPFAIFGVMGLLFWWRLYRTRSDAEPDTRHFLDPRERWPYLIVFIGVLLTAFGSAYYHLEPSNARLVWDRLPMTIAFMAVVAAIIAERISVRAGLWLLPLLVLIGMSSVLVWYRSEVNDAGDLRFYATVQAYSLLFLLIALLLPPRYTRSSDLAIVAGFYALAKVLETYDRQIFDALGHTVSGHTLKHLAAACAAYWILRMLQRRRPLPELSSSAANV